MNVIHIIAFKFIVYIKPTVSHAKRADRKNDSPKTLGSTIYDDILTNFEHQTAVSAHLTDWIVSILSSCGALCISLLISSKIQIDHRQVSHLSRNTL